jgi:SH3-like domain-containing protein
VRPRINEGEGATWRTTTLISHRARRSALPWHKNREVQLAISMSRMADRSAPIYASLAKGDGDSFTLIWSRRNGD